MSSATRRAAAVLLVSIALPSARATDGYFQHGYGVKSQGIGGVGIALPQDGLAAASNPAGTALVGNRLDAGLTWFAPSRGADVTAPNPRAGSYDGDGKRNFLLPEVGFTRQISSALGVGLALYGNGGMNTSYRNGVPLFGTGEAGVNLEQLFISPSVAWKPAERHSIGAAVNFAYQRFEAKGLGNFDPAFTTSPGSVTNRGVDTSTGWGLRLGWIGEVAPGLRLGATWSSKIRASKFDKYKGLFADGGSFDIPENYGLGLAYAATPAVTFAADLVSIRYGGVKSISLPLANIGAGLGAPNGAGFGWKDVLVVKLGVSYTHSSKLTLRAGYNRSDQPIPASQTLFNILAPAVVQDHLTLGATWVLDGGNELSVSYAHAFRKTVSGSGSIPAAFGGGEANIRLSENILGAAYAWKF